MVAVVVKTLSASDDGHNCSSFRFIYIFQDSPYACPNIRKTARHFLAEFTSVVARSEFKSDGCAVVIVRRKNANTGNLMRRLGIAHIRTTLYDAAGFRRCGYYADDGSP